MLFSGHFFVCCFLLVKTQKLSGADSNFRFPTICSSQKRDQRLLHTPICNFIGSDDSNRDFLGSGQFLSGNLKFCFLESFGFKPLPLGTCEAWIDRPEDGLHADTGQNSIF
jgi:hypothetical protein